MSAPRYEDAEVPAIQTVRRAAAIMSAFTVEHPRRILGEITAELGVSRATAHRYARALRAANLLRYDRATATYSLGPGILALDAAARAGLPLVATAEPYLEQLLRELNLTAMLSIWNGDDVTVVRCMDNTDGDVRLSVRVGSRLDATGSAQGRVFSAHLPAADVPGLARRLTDSAELRAALDEVRRTGIAVNDAEEHGVLALAAPVFERARVVAALAVVATTAALSGTARERAGAVLSQVAYAMSRQLGTA